MGIYLLLAWPQIMGGHRPVLGKAYETSMEFKLFLTVREMHYQLVSLAAHSISLPTIASRLQKSSYLL